MSGCTGSHSAGFIHHQTGELLMTRTIRNKSLLAAIVSVILASPASFAETAGEYIDDTTVGTMTKAALVDNETVSALDINVEVYKGNVQLSGFVESEAQKDAALATAGKVDGAKKVLDAIVVLPGSRSMGEAVDDTTIQAKLKAGLANVQGMGDAVAINTWVKHGHVLLAGFVDSDSVKAAAGKVASGIEGVKKVHNHIAIKH
jgi:hyperosmotically inducible protein